jgi:hypothetical protein
MTPSLKAVFESLAPGNLYDICLYDAPFRQSAARDIGWRNFDDRWRNWGMPRNAEADFTHDCALDTGMGFFSSAGVSRLPEGWRLIKAVIASCK